MKSFFLSHVKSQNFCPTKIMHYISIATYYISIATLGNLLIRQMLTASGVWNQWNGMVEWTTGMDWDKIFALACNLKCYMDQVDRYYITN